jgi:transcriptional regulator GlxA family with amidase domain
MTESRTVVLIGFDGMQLLDLTGPAAVFDMANTESGADLYRVRIGSSAGGLIQSGSVGLMSEALADINMSAVDTLLVAGGDWTAVMAAMRDPRLGDALLAAEAGPVRRIGSICSGAFVLARHGLLDGKRAATHWRGCSLFASSFPAVTVDRDATYVVDGRYWTSAGVSTGIDLALAMVEADAGAPLANAIARRMVLYARRPGSQAQFGPLLAAQTKADSGFTDLLAWMNDNLSADLSVDALAARAGQSLRSFHRKFEAATGQTPAQLVESLRLEAARALLARDLPVKQVARDSGFGSADRLTRAFERRFGLSPSLYRELHCSV